MKSLFLEYVLLLGIVLAVVTGCDSSTKTKDKKGTTSEGKEAYVEVETFDAVKIKDQIVETIREMPSEKEIAVQLNDAGASYIMDLTIPAEESEKLMTEAEQSIGLGLYSFDLLYASVYNRGDAVSDISKVSEQLIDKLGLRDELITSEGYLARIRANAGNEDSLDYLVTQDLNHYHQQMRESDQPGVYALSVIGTNVEGLYILSQTALLAQNKSQMIELMSRQTERVKQVFTLLELMSGDENIKPYYEQFKPVVSIFEEDGEITEEELAEIGTHMEAFREKILN